MFPVGTFPTNVAAGVPAVPSGSGSLALATYGARRLCAESPAFQARCGVASPAEAWSRIYYDETREQQLQPDETLAGKRPYAVVCVDQHGYIQIGEGSRLYMGGTGGVLLILSDNPQSPEDHDASFFDFVDWTSRVLDEMTALVGRDTHWPFNRVDLIAGPTRPPFNQREGDDYWLSMYCLSHHVDGGR
jgi:hypothetical protein